MQRQQKSLFDQLVGSDDQQLRDLQAECLRGREIDDQIELGRLFDRDVGRLGPAQYFVDVLGTSPVQILLVCGIGHEAPRGDQLSSAMHRWQPCIQRQGIEAIGMRRDE